MYILTHIKGPPIHLQLPGRVVPLLTKGATADVSDEEHASGAVQGRVKYKSIKAEYSEAEFETPQTAQLIQLRSRQEAASRSRRRAAGEIL